MMVLGKPIREQEKKGHQMELESWRIVNGEWKHNGKMEDIVGRSLANTKTFTFSILNGMKANEMEGI